MCEGVDKIKRTSADSQILHLYPGGGLPGGPSELNENIYIATHFHERTCTGFATFVRRGPMITTPDKIFATIQMSLFSAWI
jgi:hypothetical protein